MNALNISRWPVSSIISSLWCRTFSIFTHIAATLHSIEIDVSFMAIALNLDCWGLQEASGAEKCDKFNENGMMCLYSTPVDANPHLCNNDSILLQTIKITVSMKKNGKVMLKQNFQSEKLHFWQAGARGGRSGAKIRPKCLKTFWHPLSLPCLRLFSATLCTWFWQTRFRWHRQTLQTSPTDEPAHKHWNTTSSTLNTDHLDLHNDTQGHTISQKRPPYKPVVQERGRSKPSCLYPFDYFFSSIVVDRVAAFR